MKRSTPAIAALVVLLLLSNAFWLYKIVDERSAAGLELAEQREALMQVFALIPVVAQKADRTRIVAAAADATLPPNKQALQNDGYVWVGSLGLRFTKTGELAEIVTRFGRHSTGIMSTP